MPSTSKKQHNLMEAVAHSPAFAKKVGIKQSVGKDFAEADKGRKFGLGGSVNIVHGGKGQINKQTTRAGSVYGQQKEVPNVNLNKYIGHKEGGKMAISKLFKGKETYKEELDEAKAIKSGKITPQQYAKGEKSEGHAKGGVMKETMGPKGMGKDVEAGSNKLTKFGESAVQKSGKTKGKNFGDSGPTAKIQNGMKCGGSVKKMASGGSASSRGDGIASKGKTKGKMC